MSTVEDPQPAASREIPELTEKWFKALEKILQINRKRKLVQALESLGRKLDPRKAEHDKFEEVYRRAREALQGLADRNDSRLAGYQDEYKQLVDSSQAAATKGDAEEIKKLRRAWQDLEARLNQRLSQVQENLDPHEWEKWRFDAEQLKNACDRMWGTREQVAIFNREYLQIFERAQAGSEAVTEISRQFMNLVDQMDAAAAQASQLKSRFETVVATTRKTHPKYEAVFNSLRAAEARQKLESLNSTTLESRDWSVGIAQVESLREAWESEIARQSAAKQRVGQLVGACDELLAKLKRMMSGVEYDRLIEQKKFITANMKSHEYEEAEREFDEYRKQLHEQMSVWSDAANRWNDSTERSQMIDSWNEMRQRLRDPEGLGSNARASNLLGRIGEFEHLLNGADAMAREAGEYGVAFRLLESQLAATQEIRDTLDHLVEQRQIDGAREKLRQDTSQIEQAIPQAVAFKDAYEKLYAAALDSLGKAETHEQLETLVQQARQRIEELGQGMQSLSEVARPGVDYVDPASLEEILDRYVKEREAWERNREQLNVQLDELAQRNGSAVAGYLRQLQTLEAGIPAPLDETPPTSENLEETLDLALEAYADLRSSNETATELLADLQQANAAEAAKFQEALQRLNVRLEHFQAQRGNSPTSVEAGPAQCLKDLDDRVDRIRRMVSTATNLGTLESGAEELEETLRALAELNSALRNGVDPFAEHKKKLASLKKTCERNTLGEFQTRTAASLLLRIEEANQLVETIAPTEFVRRYLDALTSETEQCERNAEKIRNLSQQFDVIRKEVADRLKEIDKELRRRGVTSGDLKGLTGMIRRADLLKCHEDPALVQQALNLIGDIKRRLNFILNPHDPPIGVENPEEIPTLDELVQAEREAQERDEQAAKLLKQEQQAFFSRLAAFKSDLHKRASKIDLQRGDKRGKIMDKFVGKSQDLCHDGNVVSALSHLKMAEQLAQQILADPKGSSLKRKLSGLDQRWADALATVKHQLNLLLKKLRDESEAYASSSALDRQVFKAGLAKLAKFVDDLPLAYEELGLLVRQLDADGLGEGKARTLREQALQHVQRYLRFVDQDPVFKMLCQNPFEVQLTARALYVALENLRYNLLVAAN